MNDPTNRPLADLIADLEISDAQAEAGNIVPLAPVMQRLRDSITRLEAKQRGEQRREAMPRR